MTHGTYCHCMMCAIGKKIGMIQTRGDNIIYRCSECGLGYTDKEIALKCQAWCKEHKSCNLDIIKYAIKENENTSSK